MAIDIEFWDKVDQTLTDNERVMRRTLKNRVSAKRAINNRGNTLPQASHNLFVEARGWIADCFEDAPKKLSDGDVIKAINEHYDGGWRGFMADQT
jgi:hypothetical protein